MRNLGGGKLPPSFGYRSLVALLLGANLLVAGLLVRDTILRASALSPALSEGTQVISVSTDCGQAPPKLSTAHISVAQPGLTQEVIEPFYYEVQGVTPSQINASMAACSPAPAHNTQEVFAADTSYTINWQVSYRTTSPNHCKVDKIAVGLHTRHIYPHWSTEGAPAETTERWRVFMQQLIVHEEGHVALDRHYAAQVLRTLQSLPASDCRTISQEVNATANRLLQTLKAANSNYDATTQHGRTQGAVLQ